MSRKIQEGQAPPPRPADTRSEFVRINEFFQQYEPESRDDDPKSSSLPHGVQLDWTPRTELPFLSYSSTEARTPNIIGHVQLADDRLIAPPPGCRNCHAATCLTLPWSGVQVRVYWDVCDAPAGSVIDSSRITRIYSCSEVQLDQRLCSKEEIKPASRDPKCVCVCVCVYVLFVFDPPPPPFSPRKDRGLFRRVRAGGRQWCGHRSVPTAPTTIQWRGLRRLFRRGAGSVGAGVLNAESCAVSDGASSVGCARARQ